MKSRIQIFAGKKALSRLCREGLHADAVKVVAGAAGGPKWLGLSQLDRAIFGQFFAARRHPLYFLGSSIGAWRFAAACQSRPVAAIERFEESYFAQEYEPNPTPAHVSAVSRTVLDGFVSDDAVADILSHPTHRLNIITARCRWPVAREHKVGLAAGLGAAVIGNAFHRSTLKCFFERTIFHDPRERAPFLGASKFGSTQVELRPECFKQALMASGSIPTIMAGVQGIPRAPAGVYRDGGVIDYHLDVPFLDPKDDGLVLFPHFSQKIIPGWFDKALPWRRPTPAFMDHVVLVCPSPEFIEKLPLGKIPDRKDFAIFAGRDAERVAYWKTVVRECAALGDDFLEILESGRIKTVARDLI